MQDVTLAGLWVAPDGDSARARPISGTNGLAGGGGIEWTRDGRIVYGGNSQGSGDIWIANADGSQPKQLTNNPGMEAGPQLRPDGTGIIYQSRASGAADVEVWSIDLDGGNPRQIDTGGGIFRGYQETRSEHIYFKALVNGRPVAYRVPLAGGPRTRLFADPSRLPPRFDLRSVSPDERWALGRYVAPPITGIAVVPLDGAGPVRTFPHSHIPIEGIGGTWAPDGRAFEDLVFRDGAANLWRFPLDGSPPRAVTTFTSERILSVPVVTRREDAGNVARDVFGRCGVDRERRHEGVAVRLIVTSALLSALVFVGPVAAQEQRGAFEGTVRDAQGAAIPGATVAALHLEQGAAVSTVTDASGTFRFPALAPGYYDVTGSFPGFTTLKFGGGRTRPRACRGSARKP